MKKIFLSLGFKERSTENIIRDIGKAIRLITPLYPDEELKFIHNYDYVGVNRIECIGEAIKKMSTCDKVYFINDWFNYNGCIVEMQVCELYDMEYETIHV